jgi:predicted SAM-dependent methyltransferase
MPEPSQATPEAGEPSLGGQFTTVDATTPVRALSALAASSVGLLYCHGVVERIAREQIDGFLAECLRVLSPLGLLRVATADVDAIVHGYLFDWASTEAASSSRTERLNAAFGQPGIRFLYGEEELTSVLTAAGFRAIRRFTCGASSDQRLWNVERDQRYALILEATKP